MQSNTHPDGKLKLKQKISREKDINKIYIGIRLNFLSPIRHPEYSEGSRKQRGNATA